MILHELSFNITFCVTGLGNVIKQAFGMLTNNCIHKCNGLKLTCEYRYYITRPLQTCLRIFLLVRDYLHAWFLFYHTDSNSFKDKAS